MESIAAQPLLSNDEDSNSQKSQFKPKILLIYGICLVFSILVGISIGYLIFRRKPKVINLTQMHKHIKLTNNTLPYKIIITGFQPWADNLYNPSETLAEKVSQKLNETGNDSESYSLKVIPEDADSFYNRLPLLNDKSKLPFIVHIGLDGARSNLIEIESTATNMAILTSDGRGTPVSSDKNLGHQLVNTIDVAALAESLGGEFVVSNNAGTNLCNYIYYRGLENVGVKSRACVFIHIPQFEVMSVERQVANMMRLIQKIVSLPELML